jgi:aminopeptidase N
MRWFDDLWLKEGFAEFMAYKTLEKVMPEYNSWKIFYERNKQAAYLTDSTKGTTPIYQEIPNLASAKSAYGNIVYRKAPSFLKQAEFYLGVDKFQTAVRALLQKHQFANAEWTDLVKEFETASGQNLKDWANVWVKQPGVPIIRMAQAKSLDESTNLNVLKQTNVLNNNDLWKMKISVVFKFKGHTSRIQEFEFKDNNQIVISGTPNTKYANDNKADYSTFPNYQDYGYGIFLLDENIRDYAQKNIQNEKDDFLRTMMWGSLWDSVREAELAPEDYVELVIKNINVETDESTIQTLLGRVSTAMNYYLSDKQREEIAEKVEDVLIEQITTARTKGQRITFYRAFLNIASTKKAALALDNILEANNAATPAELEKYKKESNKDNPKLAFAGLPILSTKDKFDIVTKLLILGYADAPRLLSELEKSEKSDEAKRYAYAARAGIGTAENKAKFWADFVGNKELSESWIESAFGSFNSTRHAELTVPYLEKSLAELPKLKRNRKIFFVNGWLTAFIGGQKSEQALQIVNKFLADNPNLDKDLRLKVLEVSDNLERAVKIRQKFSAVK